MMTDQERRGTIDWLRQWVHRLEDLDDYEAFSDDIARLSQSIKELEDRIKCSLLEA